MNIKLTYDELNSKQMELAIAKLAREPLPVTVGWNIQRILRKINKEVKEGREIYMKLLKDCCEVDEKGELTPQRLPPIVKPDGTTEEGKLIPGSFIVKDPELFKKRNEEFLAIEIEIRSYPIKLKDIEHLKMSSEDLLHLAPLINDSVLEVVPDPA